MANKLLEAKMGPGPSKKEKELMLKVSPMKATSDSSTYFKRQGDLGAKYMTTLKGGTAGSNMIIKADKDLARQKLKGKPGYDKNGFPIKKMM
jgi:carbon monoxide dehydrogenase subunit G